MHCARKSVLLQGRTDCISLTHDLDLQCPESYGHAKVHGQQPICSEDRVETNGQTDGGDRITSLANAVGKNVRQFT